MKFDKKDSIAIFLLLAIVGTLFLWFISIPYQEEILIPENAEVDNIINGKFINIKEVAIDGIRVDQINEFTDNFKEEEISVCIEQSQWNTVNVFYQTKDKKYFVKKQKQTLIGSFEIIYDQENHGKIIIQRERGTMLWILLVLWITLSAAIGSALKKKKT